MVLDNKVIENFIVLEFEKDYYKGGSVGDNKQYNYLMLINYSL